MKKPTPAEIKAAREGARLSQSEAAALVHAPLRTWQNWEAPEGNGNHRAMSAATWELFEGKAHRAAEAFERILTPAAIAEAGTRAGLPPAADAEGLRRWLERLPVGEPTTLPGAGPL